MHKEQVAEVIFEAYYKDVSSDDFKNYGPRDSDEFYVTHNESGKTFRVQVIEVER